MNCKSSLKQNRNYSMLEPTSRRYREFNHLISNSRTFKYDDNENIRQICLKINHLPFVLFPWRQLCLLNSSMCYVITPNRNFRTPAKTFYKCFEYPNVCSDWSSNTHKFHLFEQRVYIKINKFVQGFECFTQNKSESVRRFENIECFPLDLLSLNIRFVKKKKFWD